MFNFEQFNYNKYRNIVKGGKNKKIPAEPGGKEALFFCADHK